MYVQCMYFTVYILLQDRSPPSVQSKQYNQPFNILLMHNKLFHTLF